MMTAEQARAGTSTYTIVDQIQGTIREFDQELRFNKTIQRQIHWNNVLAQAIILYYKQLGYNVTSRTYKEFTTLKISYQEA